VRRSYALFVAGVGGLVAFATAQRRLGRPRSPHAVAQLGPGAPGGVDTGRAR
ncbi:MAG: hypothetical protein QOJ35_2735, partial [Solirubrobacteraceae bacterium]|nr:hypothetical protein [Solirubrobacteraceae bacterium]